MKKNLFFLAAATIALASCSNEEVVEQTRQGKGIEFRASIAQGSTTRGVETSTTTLSQFHCTAMNGTTTWFEDVLFTKQGNQTTFASEHEYLWPGHGSLDFYAWGCNGLMPDDPDDTDKKGYVIASINNIEQQISFKPAREISDQIDLVTAYQTAVKGDNGNNGIALTFSHDLCEIQVYAKSENPEYVFDVIGFAFCNIKNNGILALKPVAAAQDDAPSTGSGNTDAAYVSPWTFADSGIDDYVSYFNPSDKTPVRLTAQYTEISGATDSKIGYVMPIPQQLTAWDHYGDPNNGQKGAFLAVLVKITNKSTSNVVFPRSSDEDGYLAGNSDEVNGYGWACVPISTLWKPGCRYIYNLDFSAGAGQFDPKDKYQPGEDILGGPIKFNVTINGWTNGNGNNVGVDMNGHGTSEQNDAIPVE